MGLKVGEGLEIKGAFTFTVQDAASGVVVARRTAPNLIVNNGLNALAESLAWALGQNQNAQLGNVLQSGWGNLGNAWGAVGIGRANPTSADPYLGLEVGRALPSFVTATNGTVILDWFFNLGQGNGSISEMGCFINAGQVLTTLGASLVSGNAYSSITVAAVPSTIPSGSTLTLGYTTSSVQLVTTTALVNSGDTSILVSSFTANSTFSAGQYVAYNSGLLLDRSVFPATSKTNTQTATLELDLTLTSS